MASTRRNQWRYVRGKWTRSLGERGYRVRLFQKRKGGTFYRAVWVDRNRNIACLHTKDRDEAERLGTLLLAELLRQESVRLPGKVTLGELWNRFQHEAVSFLDNSPTTKQDSVSRAAVLLGFFGEDCDVSQLTERDQAAYVAQRLAGGIRCTDGRVTLPVRPRSAEADLVLLHGMLAWATTVRVQGGQRWLRDNPLAGIRPALRDTTASCPASVCVRCAMPWKITSIWRSSNGSAGRRRRRK